MESQTSPSCLAHPSTMPTNSRTAASLRRQSRGNSFFMEACDISLSWAAHRSGRRRSVRSIRRGRRTGWRSSNSSRLRRQSPAPRSCRSALRAHRDDGGGPGLPRWRGAGGGTGWDSGATAAPLLGLTPWLLCLEPACPFRRERRRGFLSGLDGVLLRLDCRPNSFFLLKRWHGM
jgi:hypothetical protein